jgi:hypothetical protein
LALKGELCPSGVNLALRGELCPSGVNLPPGVNLVP